MPLPVVVSAITYIAAGALFACSVCDALFCVASFVSLSQPSFSLCGLSRCCRECVASHSSSSESVSRFGSFAGLGPSSAGIVVQHFRQSHFLLHWALCLCWLCHLLMLDVVVSLFHVGDSKQSIIDPSPRVNPCSWQWRDSCRPGFFLPGLSQSSQPSPLPVPLLPSASDFSVHVPGSLTSLVQSCSLASYCKISPNMQGPWVFSPSLTVFSPVADFLTPFPLVPLAADVRSLPAFSPPMCVPSLLSHVKCLR